MFQENLKLLRKDKKLTQKEIAEKLNINQRTYCTYEKGTREPDISMLIKLADFHKVSIDYLLDRIPH